MTSLTSRRASAPRPRLPVAPAAAGRRARPAVGLVAALVAVLGGCSGGGGAPTALQRVTGQGEGLVTVPMAASVVAGETVAVRCQRPPRGAEAAPTPVAAQIHGPEGAERVRHDSIETVFRPTRAGRARFTCDAGANDLDPHGATVEVLPAAPARVALRQATVWAVAGEPVAAACVVEDGYGNACAQPAQLEVAPPGQQTVAGVLADRVGHVGLICRAQGLAAVDGGVSVVAGAPAVVRAHVEPAAPRAGQDTRVRCVVEDARGNVLQDVPGAFDVAAPPTPMGAATLAQGILPAPPLPPPGPAFAATPQGFVPHHAGGYAVRCVYPGVAGPATMVAVHPGLPHRWRAAWPGPQEGTCYVANYSLKPAHTVIDRYGNLVEDVHLALRAEPSAGVTHATNGGLVMAIEGDYRISAVPTPQDEGAQLAPVVAHIRVDSRPPTVVIDSPVRGEMRVGGTFDPLGQQLVEGRVTDPSGIDALTINGKPPHDFVAGATEYRFSEQIPARWGHNNIIIEARDGCQNDGRTQRDYLLSPAYAPPLRRPGEVTTVPRALVARLGQKLFDDGTRGQPDDLAGLLELALSSERLTALLPHYLAAWPSDAPETGLPLREYRCLGGTQRHKPTGYEVTIDGQVTIEQPKISSLRAVDGGWQLAIAVARVRVPVRLHTYADWWCAGGKEDQLPAVLSAQDLVVELSVEAAPGADGRPELRVCDGCVHTRFQDGEPRLQVNWDEVKTLGMKDLLEHMLDAALTAFRRGVQASLQEQLRIDVLANMQKFVDSWQLCRTITLPRPIGGGATVTSHIDQIAFAGPDAGGYGELSLGLQFRPEQTTGGRQAPQGPIRGPELVPQPTLGPNQSIAVAVRDDVFNALFHTLWASGTFDVPALEVVIAAFQKDAAKALAGSHLSIDCALPPVLMPAPAPNHVLIGLGDVAVHARVFTGRLYGGSGDEDEDRDGAARAPFDAQAEVPVELVVDASIVVDVELEDSTAAADAVLPPDAAGGGGHIVAPSGPAPAPGSAAAGASRARRDMWVKGASITSLEIAVRDSSNPQLETVGSEVVRRWLGAGVLELLSAAMTSMPLPPLDVDQIPGVPAGLAWRPEAAGVERPERARVTKVGGGLKFFTNSAPAAAGTRTDATAATEEDG